MNPITRYARVAAAVGVAVALLVGAAACSSGSDVAAPVPSQPARPKLAKDVAWVDGLCDVASSLRASVTALGQAIDDVPSTDAAPTQGTPGFADARSHVQTRLGSVGGAATEFSVALDDPPNASLAAVRKAVERSTGSIQSDVSRLKGSADAVTQSSSLEGLSVAVQDLNAPLTATGASADRLVATVRTQAKSPDRRTRATFAAAPSCAPYLP